MTTKKQVFQFRVALRGIEPPIWRRIQVPSRYRFWDLHVALQDSMGWLDYHLHSFHVRDRESGESIEIGIPDPDGFDEHACLPGWEIPISEFFGQPGDRAMYAYDFGDGWEHAVVLEAIVEGVPSQRYPLCLAGERACPPEDCGGVPGYEELLQILQDPSHDEYEERVHWLGRVYDPEEFNHREVKFDDPRKRWNAAFAET